MEKKRVFIGVSGGVDSTVAVMLLKKEGYDVTGVHLKMVGEQDKDVASLEERLGVPVLSVDVAQRFRRTVVDPFVAAYVRGETPSPCADCNPMMKWKVLEETADAYGGKAAKIATGHYCRIEQLNGYYYIARAKDDTKNQSYYLWQLSQQTLSRALFPLGNYEKREIKALAAECGLELFAQKRESMGICFLKGAKIGDFLLAERPELASLKGGEVVDEQGRVVGTHDGYPFYTLAQRKGLPIEKGRCVVAVDPAANRVVVGSPDDLFRESFVVGRWQVVDESEFFATDRLRVDVRGIGLNPAGYCAVCLKENRIFVRLLSDRAWAVAKGQPVVFYIDDRVVGGGIIE